MIRNANDVIEEIDPTLTEIENSGGTSRMQEILPSQKETVESISGIESKLLKAFREGDHFSLEELCEISRMEVSELSSNLTMLELGGLVSRRADGRFEAI